MIPIPGENDWDFGPVFDLIRSLSISGGENAHQNKAIGDTDTVPPEQAKCTPAIQLHKQEITQLGDFNKVWQFLGQPLDLPPPEIGAGSSPDSVDVWDGQTTSTRPTLKAVRWQDDLECTSHADVDEKNGVTDLSNLTKQQRKKARRKQRQQERQALAAQPTNTKALLSGSEDESGKDAQEYKSLDRSGVIYRILHGSSPPINPGRLRSGKPFRIQDPHDARAMPAAPSSSARPIVQIFKPVDESSLEVAAAKKQKLMSMLNERFLEDRLYLNNLSFTLIAANRTVAAAEGIHVFVDASNVRCNSPHLPFIRR